MCHEIHGIAYCAYLYCMCHVFLLRSMECCVTASLSHAEAKAEQQIVRIFTIVRRIDKMCVCVCVCVCAVCVCCVKKDPEMM